MGLDMYLRRYPNVFRNGEKINIHECDPDELAENNKDLYDFLKPYEKVVRIGYIKYKSYSVEVGYLRKANAIHSWFVENIQDGIDDCKPSFVAREQLETLLDICYKVRKSCKLISGKVFKVVEDNTIAEQLLPTQSGFFFGAMDYDEYYVDAIDETIRIIQKILDETDFEKDEIYYCSSW